MTNWLLEIRFLGIRNQPKMGFCQVERSTHLCRGLVSIMNLGERNFFLPNKGQLIGNFFEILLSKYQKLGGAMAPLAPPLTRALVSSNSHYLNFGLNTNYFDILGFRCRKSIWRDYTKCGQTCW